MNRPTFYIQKNNTQYALQLHDAQDNLLLSSKFFADFRRCEKFLDELRVHMCFQTNFSRCKNQQGLFGFEIRTCWDDLVASSIWFTSRKERETAMQVTFQANKNAIFIHTRMHKTRVREHISEVA